MKTHFKPLVLAMILGTATLTAMAQPAGDAPPQGGDHMGHMREHMQEHMTKRIEELKAKLKLSPQQEAGWSTYVAAMKPSAPAAHPRPEDWAKLTTPERLDKLRDLRKGHDVEFNKRDDATRTFYTSLSAEQKKVFDDATAHMSPEGHRPGPR
jgi:protein CpxP